MSTGTDSLYAAWKKIYPRFQPGFFRTLRWVLYGSELAVFFLLPLLRWERPEGLPNQAVLFDLPARKFYLFDLIIWPQDIFVLAFLLIAAALGLFFMTALAGRVFCGYLCIQTVWTDWMLQVEMLFEGNRKQRIRLDQSPWTVGKLLVKLGKHATWLSISAATGIAFVCYFIDAPTLWQQFLEGTVPFPAWFTAFILALVTYLMAGFAREQVCIYMCPYARFQGAMFDDDTIIVAYHPELGEPRESNRRKRTEMGGRAGECIDCEACVTVCPTGIDIRDGQQYECITCAACIDACDSVRRRLGASERTLICYTSLREMQGGQTHWLRGRVVLYAGLLLVFMGAIAVYLAGRSNVELTVIGHRQPLYITQSDGAIQNNYTVRIVNMTDRPQSYTLTVKGVAGGLLSVAAAGDRNARGDPLLTVPPGSVTPFSVYLRQPRAQLEAGGIPVVFALTAQDPQGGFASYKNVFVRP